MENINEIKELRKRVPVSISQAIVLLKKYEGDINAAEEFFRQESLSEICTVTNVDIDTAEQHYEACQLDIAKTITSIFNEIYDNNYIAPDFLTKEKLDIIMEWLKLEDTEIFEVALSYNKLAIVIDTLSRFENLLPISQAIEKSKEIFNSYDISETTDAKKYVETIDVLRQNENYQIQQSYFIQNKYKLEQELEKHYRNIDKIPVQ